jgi:hypothetical protein
MRALVVLCLVAGCGDNGLMLEIHSGTSDVKSVEVFIPGNNVSAQMAIPMATAPTTGVVYETADRVTAARADTQILLQPGSIDSVPELLVLGYDANHKAIRYANVHNASGAIQLPHTHADTIKVDLDPIDEVPAASASRQGSTGPLLVRWSQAMVDDPNGNCVGLLSSDGHGTFFSPTDDHDCDNAKPECDDFWYLKVGAPNAMVDHPYCARDDRTPDTMDACRMGATVACTDNVGDCNIPTSTAICLPAAVCDACHDQIDQSCIVSGLTDGATPRVECDLSVGINTTTQMLELCNPTNTSDVMTLDLGPQFGGTFGITGAEFDQPPATSGGTNILSLNGSTTAKLTVTPPQVGARGLTFTAENGLTPAINSSLPDTTALLVIAVHGGVSRALVLPFVAHYVSDCTAQPTCRLVIGMKNGQSFDDPIWHCAGM